MILVKKMVEKTQWDSPVAFILAMIGAAVGLGNIWRFSYVVYSNGGGSFFIPYLIAIAIILIECRNIHHSSLLPRQHCPLYYNPHWKPTPYYLIHCSH